MGLFTYYILNVAAVFAVIIGLLLILFPKAVSKINEMGTSLVVRTDKMLSKHRLIFGILMLIFAVLLVYYIRTIPLKL